MRTVAGRCETRLTGCVTTDGIGGGMVKGNSWCLAFRTNPNRFVNKAPAPPQKPTAVWINPPAQKLKLQA